MTGSYDLPSHKRSRGAYLASCAYEYLVSLCVTDAFLAKLLTSMGLDDSTIGIISSFVSLAFVVQLASIALNRARMNAKKTVILFHTASQMLFFAVYIIPFLPIGGKAARLMAMGAMLLAYFFNYLIANIYFRWANSFVDPRRRASFSSVKEIISLIAGILFTAVTGRIFDRMEASGDIKRGFLMLAALILLLNIIDLVTLLRISPEKRDISEKSPSLRDVLSATLGNRDFKSVMLMQIVYDTGKYFTIGFIGVYKTNDLLLSVFMIQLINITGNLMRIAVSYAFGRFSDKTSFAKGMEVALLISAASFLVNIFTVPSRWYLIIVYTVLNSVSLAGVGQNSSNITYSYIDPRYVTEALSLKNSISGLCGFFASIAAAAILRAVQAGGNTVFGLHIYGQQLLSAISFLLVLSAAAIAHFRILPAHVRKQ